MGFKPMTSVIQVQCIAWQKMACRKMVKWNMLPTYVTLRGSVSHTITLWHHLDHTGWTDAWLTHCYFVCKKNQMLDTMIIQFSVLNPLGSLLISCKCSPLCAIYLTRKLSLSVNAPIANMAFWSFVKNTVKHGIRLTPYEVDTLLCGHHILL